ncbi:MAG: PD-(D/E)XK nuclease family protein, partial [Lachnospiraceae bacterium]|nr:PD-(D/E)XK nuclease family protein [Lachnospiraceae bacterium]
DSDGKLIRASSVLAKIKDILPGIKEYDGSTIGTDEISGPGDAADLIIKGLRDIRKEGPDDRFRQAYGWLLSRDEYRQKAESLKEAAFSCNDRERLDKLSADLLYNRELAGSITNLGRYASCPYAFFTEYGLKLKDRLKYRLEAPDMGSIYHEVLKAFSEEMKAGGYDWRSITDEKCNELIAGCIEKTTDEYKNSILKDSERSRYIIKRIERIIERTVRTIRYQAAHGSFNEWKYELPFSIDLGSKTGGAEDVGLKLKGIIDRVDICNDGDSVYVGIVDYKSGDRDLSLAKVFYGLDMQLPVYLHAAMERLQRENPDKEIVPAGMLYYHIDDPLLDESDEEMPEGDSPIYEVLRPRGYVNGDREVINVYDRFIDGSSKVIRVKLSKDGSVSKSSKTMNRGQFADLDIFVTDKAKELAGNILGGDIKADPYQSGNNTACDYCNYKSVCGFDKDLRGYGYRKIGDPGDEEIWRMICEEDAADGSKLD